jgi:hypothetical protein
MDLKNSLKAKLSWTLGAGLLFSSSALAQQDDGGTHVFHPNVHSVQLYAKGSQTTVPIIQLSGGDQLDLDFDDLDGDVKNYGYLYELRNEDWSPSTLNTMEYIKGFQNAPISNYKISSIALAHYTHYHAHLPEDNYGPSKGGNYLLKVFQNGDPSDVVFQVRMLVVNNTMPVTAQVQPPFASELYKTHQKVQFNVGTGTRQFTNPIQEVKVAIVQNWRWESAKYDIRPTFVRNNSLEYNPESDAVFPGAREWRWLDIRSFRFQSDRLARIDEGPDRIAVAVRTDQSRAEYPYVTYQDYNGAYTISASESIVPAYQGDYARVNFSYAPPGGEPYNGKDLYVYGALSNYAFDDSTKMRWDPEKKLYRAAFFLKQGYYDYYYVLRDRDGNVDVSQTEGDFYETENSYLILVYYRPLGARFDELVGLGRVNSLQANNPQGVQ